MRMGILLLLCAVQTHMTSLPRSYPGRHQQNLVKCVVLVCRRYFRHKLTLVTSARNLTLGPKEHVTLDIYQNNNLEDVLDAILRDLESHMDWPLVVSVGGRTADHVTDGGYLILTPWRGQKELTTDTLHAQIEEQSRSPSWNARSRFLIIVPWCDPSDKISLVNALLGQLWEFNILNVMVLLSFVAVLEGPVPTTTIETYTWFPNHKSGDCEADVRDVIRLESWSLEDHDELMVAQDLFPSKTPRNFNGCPIRVTSFRYEPFWMSTVDGQYDSGIEFLLMKVLSEKNNLSMTFLPPPPKSEGWGRHYPNGTWTGLVGNVIYERADVAIAGLMATTERASVMDMSHVYHTDSVVWTVPRARPVPKWQSLSRIFSPVTWSLILSIYLISPLVLWGLAVRRSGESLGLVECFLGLWSTMMMVGLTHVPRDSALRVFLLLFIVYCLILQIAYQSLLVSSLTNPGYQTQIKDVDGLLESGMRYGFHPTTVRFFHEDFDRYWRTFLSHGTSCADMLVCLNRTAFGGDFAMALAERFLDFQISDKYVDDEGKPLVIKFAKREVTFNVAMYLRRWSPFYVRFNEQIGRLVRAGLLNKWEKDIQVIYRLRAAMSILTRTSSYPVHVLTVTHLQGAFGILLVGLTVDTLVLLCELTRFHHAPRVGVIN